MCGIVGYVGGRKAGGIIYSGLKQLEYRGYDSAGIATLEDGKISVVKRRGKVSVLQPYIGGLGGTAGIGHTRWATHGGPSDENAHPHSAGKFSIVHNGIIENYSELKEKYFPDTAFLSETDSEIIARLLDKFYDGDFLYALKRVADLLKGSYAAAVICADFQGLALIKRNNPAIIGYGEGENFAASDAPALSFCKQITILEDGDVAVLTADGVSIFNEHLQGVIRERIANPATPLSLELGDCPHYMLKEIREVPASVERTRTAYLSVENKVGLTLAGAERIIITGCGTAYNSGIIAKRFIETFAHMPVETEIAGEFRYKNPIITPNTVVVAISQSGETADTVEAAKLAKRLGAVVIAVTNAPYSQLTRCADAVVPVEAGSEICVAATKSYTGQLTALYLMAKTLAGQGAAEAVKSLSAVAPLCERVIAEGADIDTLADMCARASGVYFLGRDIDHGVALEGSLKLKEISYVPSEGYPAGELKHGTLALIDIRTVSVFLITCPRLAEKSANAVEQVLSRKGKAAVITNVAAVRERFAGRVPVISLPECDEYLSPFLTAAAVQLLAYKTALLLDRDPDKPRNLAKSVTVE